VKVFVLAPREDWICDRLASEWYEHFSDVSTKNPYEADVIWILAGWCWNHLPQELLRSKKVIVTEHHIVPEKFNTQKYQDFVNRDQFVDAYHVPNDKTKFFLSQLTKKPIFVVSYWLNDKIWKPLERDTARQNFNIPKQDFCVGSFQRDTEGYDLKTPKLEKGPDIFCDFVEKIQNENLHVLLGGFRRQYVINRLKEKSIRYSLYENVEQSKIRELYACCDLYVVSSRFEGGPQAVIEAAAMKIPILSTDVGIASNVLSKKCITDLSTFFVPTEEIEYNFNNVQKIKIDLIGQDLIRMFKGV
jgi:glycosyltransferase involved in cell wall biosynthesis